ncbi:MAG: hypothetical protein ACFE0P_15270 [Oceanicaulis sp.]
MKFAYGVSVLSLVVSGCATGGNQAGMTGGFLGGLAGAAACLASGANDTECALLVVGGAVAGYAVAEYIDRRDREAYQAATQDVLSGETRSATRVSEQTGNTITVSRSESAETFQNEAGQTCTATDVAYQGETHQDIWCRGEDGTWTIRQA